MQWQQIIEFLGGATVFGGVIAYLGKTAIDAYVNGRVEAYKAELQRLTTEHSVRFQRLHSERAEVIKEFCAKFVELDETMHSTLRAFQRVGEPALKEKVAQLADQFNGLRNYYLPRRIFFAEPLCTLIDSILNVRPHMTIDTSGKWWKGSAPEDLEEYLHALTADGYQATEFRLSQCQCGGVRFFLEVEPNEGVAKRRCEKCSTEHFICDSKEHWQDGLKTKKYKCITCKSKVANVGVGFAFYEDAAAVHWLYVGNRCAECGILGSMVDWKVGYEPSLHLRDEA